MLIIIRGDERWCQRSPGFTWRPQRVSQELRTRMHIAPGHIAVIESNSLFHWVFSHKSYIPHSVIFFCSYSWLWLRDTSFLWSSSLSNYYCSFLVYFLALFSRWVSKLCQCCNNNNNNNRFLPSSTAGQFHRISHGSHRTSSTVAVWRVSCKLSTSVCTSSQEITCHAGGNQSVVRTSKGESHGAKLICVLKPYANFLVCYWNLVSIGMLSAASNRKILLQSGLTIGKFIISLKGSRHQVWFISA